MATLIVGGVTVLERQARQLRRAGVSTLLLVDAVPLTVLPDGVEAAATAQLPALIAADDRVVTIASGLVIDERAIAAVLDVEAPAMLVCDAAAIAAVSIERIDSATVWAGVMALSGAMVRQQAAMLGDWDLASTLTRLAATDPSTQRIDFLALPAYAPARRRNAPHIWHRPISPDEARAAGESLVAAAQKGCLDWPARFLHPWPEDMLVRLLAPTPVTPNMVTIATAIIGVAAGVAFASGWLWTGLILALITGPLDGVDGKLARTRCEFSKWGDLEHLVDKVLEYSWYLCIAGHFAAQQQSALPWAIAALIILPAFAEAVQGEFFRRLTGVQLDDAGDVERRIRLVAGRRNTFLWTWLPLAFFGLWFEGFVVLAFYSILTTAVAQWRFYKRLSAYGRSHGGQIATNYITTGYTFLPPTTL
ncbi:MAG: CDP-alcohol phosphatidyltransferase family protein [Sandarakinorhabdus sp.]|nr:CDP-alcohol phosphatidyltransferase family protein [Sandarakinorhabdus sp.]